MGRLRTEEVRRLLRYLSERLEDSERLAEIEDALRDEDAENETPKLNSRLANRAGAWCRAEHLCAAAEADSGACRSD